MAKKCICIPLLFYYKHLNPKTKKKHVVAAFLMYILIFNKIGRHVGGHLGFLGPHHDSSQSPSIFLHLRYASNHLCNNFLWTSHAHRYPLRDCITIKTDVFSLVCNYLRPSNNSRQLVFDIHVVVLALIIC